MRQAIHDLNLEAAPTGGRGVYLINQFDFAENAIQVSCMKEIYEMAETIIVWLGESGPKMEKFANSLRRIGKEASVIGVLNVIH